MKLKTWLLPVRIAIKTKAHLGSYDNIVPIFHPRKDNWFAHFDALDGVIADVTEKGEATVKLLKLNDPERIIIRRILQEIGAFP